MIIIYMNELSLKNLMKELQILVDKANGLGIREDLTSMTLEELHGLYLFLKRSQAS